MSRNKRFRTFLEVDQSDQRIREFTAPRGHRRKERTNRDVPTHSSRVRRRSRVCVCGSSTIPGFSPSHAKTVLTVVLNGVKEGKVYRELWVARGAETRKRGEREKRKRKRF